MSLPDGNDIKIYILILFQFVISIVLFPSVYKEWDNYGTVMRHIGHKKHG